ncbi:MAG: hypothetical protein JO100_07255 [Pseudonocardia sp.]|jgi:hypothetical protein|nr:hypothetical protein [Pseudonocardia sp.]
MRTSKTLLVIGVAVASLTIVIPGVALAVPPASSAPPTGPAYICDNVNDVPGYPGAFGYTKCEPFGGMTTSGFIPNYQSYILMNRTGDPRKTFQCSGGYADMPTSIGPKRCHLESSVPAAQAPAPVPFSGP